MTAARRPKWLESRGFVTGLLVLAALALYLPVATKWGTWHFDDFHSITENESVCSLRNLGRFFTDPQAFSGEPGNVMYRPVLLLSYAIDYALWGYDAHGWFLTNAILHGACAALVYRLARRIGLSDLASAFAGAVFVLHPALCEVQNYVSSRSESLAALLLLAAFHLHLSARERSGAKAAALFAGALGVSMLAIGAKETAAGFCAAVAVYEIVRGDGRLRPLAAAGLYAAGLVAVLAVRAKLLGQATAAVPLAGAPQGPDPRLGGSLSVLDNVLKVQSRVAVLYGQILFRPVALNVDYDVARGAAWTAAAVAALASHAGVALGAVASFVRGRRLFPLCTAWFWILLAPSIAFPLNVVMNEHRLYLPMVAVALLAGAALGRVAELLAARWGSFAVGASVAAAPLALFVPLVVQRSWEWHDDETLWSRAVERAPGSARAHMHLGAVWHDRANGTWDRAERVRLYDAALAEYAVSERLLPGWPDLYFDLGNAWLKRGEATNDPADFERALAAYTRWGELVGPDMPRPRMLRATVLSELGRCDEAAAIVRDLAAKDTAVTTLYDDLLARILRKKGDRRGAAEAMERVVALQVKQGRVDALLDLAWWYFEDGDLDAAQERIQRAITLVERTPSEYKPYLWACRFLVLTGNRKAAEDMFRLYRRRRGADDLVEAAYAAGGATPGVFTGTFGVRGATTR